ncbi:Fic family protein [soil metagenome]
MNRYEVGRSEECEPGSNGLVLRNRLGITEPRTADLEEALRLLQAQDESYARIGFDTLLSVDLIRDLHRSWLGGLYPFAGEIRGVDVSKDGFMFAPVANLDGSLRELDRVLAEETPCSGKDEEALSRSIARAHAELLLVHPFREGNGRLARWVADLMALQAGFPLLDWRFDLDTEDRRKRYFAALRRGYAMDLNALEALVREALRPRESF